MKIKINITKTPEVTFSIKTLLVFVVSFLFYLIANYLYLRLSSYNQIQQNLKNTTGRVLNDLTFKDNKWDTSGYVNDDQMPPAGQPLYIITSDGFVIDRESQIKGLLDKSDFRYASSFEKPQTITTPASEVWRMYSKVISNKDGNPMGTIFIGYYQPDLKVLDDVDKMLTTNADTLASEININGDNLDTSNVDSRRISIFLSFEVIDKFNHTLSSFGGMPAFIDRSYLNDLMQNKEQQIIDTKTKDKFDVYSMPVLDNSKKPVGLVAVGYPLKQVNQVLHNQLFFSIISGITIIVLTVTLLAFLLKNELAKIAEEIKANIQKSLPPILGGKQGLTFDKDKSIIRLNDTEPKELKIPYASYQYDICRVLFSNTKKRWELDEIMDRMGENYDDLMPRQMWRKIYDAVRLLNEKGNPVFKENIILAEAKTFRINTQIQPQNS